MTTTPLPLDFQLRSAIATRRLVRLAYNGKRRVMEPHDYGVKDGVTRLLAYQLNVVTGSSIEAASGWRLLDTAKISDLIVLEEGFAGSRNAGQRHQDWDILYARVT